MRRDEWSPTERQRARYRGVHAARTRRPAAAVLAAVEVVPAPIPGAAPGVFGDAATVEAAKAWLWRPAVLRRCRTIAAPTVELDHHIAADDDLELDGGYDRTAVPATPDPATQPARSLVAAPTGPPLAA